MVQSGCSGSDRLVVVKVARPYGRVYCFSRYGIQPKFSLIKSVS